MSRLRHVAFALYSVACVLALVWPGYPLAAGRIEPYVLGLPFSLAWIVGWVMLTFVALLIYHWTEPSPDSGPGRS